MCTRYPIINRVSELKVHIELTRFVQPEKIEIDANERAVNEKSPYCFFVCTTFDSFLNDLLLPTNLQTFFVLFYSPNNVLNTFFSFRTKCFKLFYFQKICQTFYAKNVNITFFTFLRNFPCHFFI